jgi:hypothetical protein
MLAAGHDFEQQMLFHRDYLKPARFKFEYGWNYFNTMISEDTCEGQECTADAVYTIHDNGGRPYQVKIYGHTARADKVEIYNNDGSTQPALTIGVLNSVHRVFIGPHADHPMNARMACGEQFQGCTVLIHLRDLDYLWVGNRGVQKFTALSPITEFESPMGSSNVAYPWALDAAGNYYLMLDDVILQARGDRGSLDTAILARGDPYQYYLRTCQSRWFKEGVTSRATYLASAG